MKIAILKPNPLNIYFPEKVDGNLFPLVQFLTDGPQYFKEWLNENEESVTGGNSFYLIREKKDDTSVVIGFAYTDEDNPEELEIETQQLINIIEKWQELTSKNTEEIYLIKDKDKIYLTDEPPNH